MESEEDEKIRKMNEGRKGVNERDLVGLTQRDRIELIRKHAKFVKGKGNIGFIKSTEDLDAFERFKSKYYNFRKKVKIKEEGFRRKKATKQK